MCRIPMLVSLLIISQSFAATHASAQSPSVGHGWQSGRPAEGCVLRVWLPDSAAFQAISWSEPSCKPETIATGRGTLVMTINGAKSSWNGTMKNGVQHGEWTQEQVDANPPVKVNHNFNMGCWLNAAGQASDGCEPWLDR